MESVLLFPSNPNWKLIVSPEKNFGSANPKLIVQTLEANKSLFEHYWGAELVNSEPLTISRSMENPVTYRDENLIQLNIDEPCLDRLTYQFAHEFCHYVIKKRVNLQFRWFVETICETSSLFFLIKSAAQWSQNAPLPELKEYASRFLRYFANTIKNAIDIEHLPLSQYLAEHLSELENYCYDRPKNLLIALHLLPIFLRTPSLWHEVPNIGRWPNFLDIRQNMATWLNNANAANRPAMEEIERVLFHQV